MLTQPARERFAELEQRWAGLRAQVERLEQQDVPAFNRLLEEADVDGVIVPKKPAPGNAM